MARDMVQDFLNATMGAQAVVFAVNWFTWSEEKRQEHLDKPYDGLLFENETQAEAAIDDALQRIKDAGRAMGFGRDEPVLSMMTNMLEGARKRLHATPEQRELMDQRDKTLLDRLLNIPKS